jgi:hypothetical protein
MATPSNVATSRKPYYLLPILKGSKIMTNYTYNGWKNRETWLVNVWYGDNWTCRDDVHLTQYLLEEQVEDLGNGILQDMIDLGCIDWETLREHAHTEDEEEEE